MYHKFRREETDRLAQIEHHNDINFDNTGHALEWRDPYDIRQPAHITSVPAMNTATTFTTTRISLNSNNQDDNNQNISGRDLSHPARLSREGHVRDSSNSLTQHSNMTDLTEFSDIARISEHEDTDNDLGPNLLPIQRDM